MKVWDPVLGFPAHGPDLTEGLGVPRESDPEAQWDWITRLPQGWGRWRLQTLRAQTKPCTHQSRLRGKEQ